jgi:hypothetical protein
MERCGEISDNNRKSAGRQMRIAAKEELSSYTFKPHDGL